MGHGKETPRQKMIGMMYLVLTALLALNVSADILNAFVLVDEGLVKTTANFVAKNASSYEMFDVAYEKSPAKVEKFRTDAYSVKDWADQLAYDIQELKVEVIKLCDGPTAPSLTSAVWLIGEKGEEKSTYDINGHLIQNKDNTDKPALIMINNGKGKELKEKIIKYRDFLLSLTNDPSLQKTIQDVLNTDDPPEVKGLRHTWESSRFEHLPMVAVVTNLSKMQGDVRNAEADIIKDLLSQIGATDTKVNKMEAIIRPKSNYILVGGEFEARVILAAYDSLNRPDILLGPYKRVGDDWEMVGEGTKVPYDAKGQAIIKRSASSVGNFTVQGLLKMPTPEGIKSYPFTTDYQVGQSQTVISATKMNVLYIGVDNPISVSMSGVPMEKISVSMTNGSITKSGNEWIAKPASSGTAKITASASVEGRTLTGSQDYRVKMLPRPIAKVGGKPGGTIDKNVLVSQTGVLADMEDFLFDLRYAVTQFNLEVVTAQGLRTLQSSSAAFTPEQKNFLNGLTKGQQVIISGIKARGPDGVRDLIDIVFKIN